MNLKRAGNTEQKSFHRAGQSRAEQGWRLAGKQAGVWVHSKDSLMGMGVKGVPAPWSWLCQASSGVQADPTEDLVPRPVPLGEQRWTAGFCEPLTSKDQQPCQDEDLLGPHKLPYFCFFK